MMYVRTLPAARLAAMLIATFLLVGLSACGEPEKLPPDKVIEKAVPALQAANSFHFTLETSKVQKAPPGIFITKADGDVAKPDKMAGDVSGLASGIPVNIKVVVDGSSQYMTDPISGKWGPMSPFFNVAEFFNPSRGVADIIANVKNLKDDGAEQIDGADTYRLKATVPVSALKALSPEVSGDGELPTTLWVGSSDFLLRRVRLEGPFLGGEPADIVRTITMKDFNKEVKVETPLVK